MQERLLVLGGGESGVGAAILALKKGFDVFLSDRGKITEKYKKMLEDAGVKYEEGKHSFEMFFEFSEVVKSPGIPDSLEFIKEFQKRGIPVISEIEFACRYTDAFLIAITGSNGKTTTTNLVYQLLKSAGKDIALVGNVGQSFALRIAENPASMYALELSSFQLDGIKDFRPDISILLNISPDHLDRYDYDFDKYADSKLRISLNQRAGDLFIYNKSDVKTNDRLDRISEGVRQFAVDMNNLDELKDTFTWANKGLQGKHNLFNAACAIKVAQSCGLTDTEIQHGLDLFTNDPHRLESFLESEGVEYINDSKATNVEAVYYALDALDGPIIWIAGGVDKGNDYSVLDELVKNKVEGLICLGKDNAPLVDYFENKIEQLASVDSLELMIEKIKDWKKAGVKILMSPACASFDLFNNYMHRGDAFKSIILKNFRTK
jgi:UDP-N-acetylmuramoylalanine--D-glutamate ligase